MFPSNGDDTPPRPPVKSNPTPPKRDYVPYIFVAFVVVCLISAYLFR